MLNLSLEQVMQYAKDYKAVPVAKECLADMLTPLAFLDNVRRSSRNYFLLESIEGGEHWARYSFVGYDPVLRLKITDGNAEIISGAAVKYQENDPLGCIRHILEEYKAPQIEGLPNFTGGLVGTFGFDFMRYCEPDMRVNKERKAEFADVDLMLFVKLIAFDYLKQKIFLIVNVKTDNAAINYDKAERRRFVPARLLTSWSRSAAVFMAAAWVILILAVTWISALRSALWSRRMTGFIFRLVAVL